MDFQSPAGKLAAEHLYQYRQETFDRPPLVKDGSEWASLLRSTAPEPGPYFTDAEWAERCRGLPIRENPVTYRPMIDWQKFAETYAAGLKEANSKIRLLEDEVARLTPPAPQPERTTSDVLARCIGLDKPLDAYGR